MDAPLHHYRWPFGLPGLARHGRVLGTARRSSGQHNLLGALGHAVPAHGLHQWPKHGPKGDGLARRPTGPNVLVPVRAPDARYVATDAASVRLLVSRRRSC